MIDFYKQPTLCSSCYEKTGIPIIDDDNYLIYRCSHCGWRNEKTDYFKLDQKTVDEIKERNSRKQI